MPTPKQTNLLIDLRQSTLTGAAFSEVALLDPVRAPGGWGVFASIGPNFRHTVFGRDSIEVAEDIYEYDQQLAHDIIIALARLQGTSFNQLTEEEPGKIHHEYRTTHFADEPVPELSLGIMRKLQEMWGDTTEDTMLYYGAHDATPLFIRLVRKYTDRYGDDILSESFINKDGTSRNLLESLHAATDWLIRKLHQREDRLLAYQRSNPKGIENQVWKDSRTAYLFSDGTLPDFDKGIVSTELQGYAYDALCYAARLFPQRSAECTELADTVQRSTIEKLWMADKQFFAQGIGTHESGEERVIDTLTSNGALVLDSDILADLPEWARDMYVHGVEQTMLSAEFLTPVGIRCRALSHAKLLPFVDYHGSYASWPKETSDIARGLQTFGKTASATTLHKTIFNAFVQAGEFYELFYVDTNNTVYYDQEEAITRLSSPNMGEPLPVPEPGQAWSITAAILASRSVHAKPTKTSFQKTIDAIREFPHRRQMPKSRVPSFSQLLLSIQEVLSRRSRP